MRGVWFEMIVRESAASSITKELNRELFKLCVYINIYSVNMTKGNVQATLPISHLSQQKKEKGKGTRLLQVLINSYHFQTISDQIEIRNISKWPWRWNPFKSCHTAKFQTITNLKQNELPSVGFVFWFYGFDLVYESLEMKSPMLREKQESENLLIPW